MVDTASEQGARVDRRLREEQIVWLTTVREDGQPQPMPVWFLWDGETFLIYSKPNAPKLRNMRGNNRVALNLHTNEHGGDVVRFEGTAVILDSPPPPAAVDAYMEKYAAGIAGLGMTPETMARTYSAAVRVTPGRLRTW